MNNTILLHRVKFETREEYAIEYLEQVISQYAALCNLHPETVVRGRGHHKSTEQRLYDKLK